MGIPSIERLYNDYSLQVKAQVKIASEQRQHANHKALTKDTFKILEAQLVEHRKIYEKYKGDYLYSSNSLGLSHYAREFNLAMGSYARSIDLLEEIRQKFIESQNPPQKADSEKPFLPKASIEAPNNYAKVCHLSKKHLSEKEPLVRTTSAPSLTETLVKKVSRASSTPNLATKNLPIVPHSPKNITTVHQEEEEGDSWVHVHEHEKSKFTGLKDLLGKIWNYKIV